MALEADADYALPTEDTVVITEYDPERGETMQ